MSRYNRSLLTVLALAGSVAAAEGCSATTTGGTSAGGTDALSSQTLLFIQRQTTTGQRAGARLPALRARRQPEPALARPRRRDGDQPDRRLHDGRLQRRRRVVRRDAGRLLDEEDANDHYHIYTVQLSPARTASTRSTRRRRAIRTTSTRSTCRAASSPSSRTRCTRRWGPAPTSTSTRASSPARDHQRRRRRRRPAPLPAEPLAHRGAVPPLRRRIGFSQWEHFGPTNDVKLFARQPRRHSR
jgi:hypothetical protein